MKCECGCGAEAKPKRRFIPGHNSKFIKRASTQYARVSLALSKPKVSLLCETCGRGFSVAQYREQTAKYCSLKCRSKGVYPKAKASGFTAEGRTPANKGKTCSVETKNKLSESHLGQKAWNAGTGDPVKKHINNNVRSAVGRTISKGTKKMRHWEGLVGWTVHQLRAHIEKQFKQGMTWGNYGEWHIDHKIPIAAFNFSKPEDFDFKRCWSLKNLQPMWRADNLKKGAKLEQPFQPGLKEIAEYGRRMIGENGIMKMNYEAIPGAKINRLLPKGD